MLVVGECLVDLAPTLVPSAAGEGHAPHGRPYEAIPGGGPANVALGLARLGAPAAFAGRFAKEGFGPWLREHLAVNGVDLSPSIEASEPATLAVVTFDGAGRASYGFYGPETADWQWSASELPRPDGLFAAVHTGSLATTFEPGASVISDWLAGLRAAGDVAVSFDPNVRSGLVADVAAYRGRLERLVASSHLVKASDEDVAAVYPEEDLERVAESWLASGASLVVVTEAARGARAFHISGTRAACASPAVEVVDTIGAGDAFSSGLLAYLLSVGALSPAGLRSLEEDELARALGQAVAVSAFTCTRAGADPPTAAELARFRDAAVRRPA